MVQLTVPQAKNYSAPLNAIPYDLLDQPAPEGNQLISCQVNWGAGDGGANNCVYVNPQNNSTLKFSRIMALKIDNSQCGAAVTFTAPDTGDTVTVNAYQPLAIVEFFTQGVQFYVQAIGTVLAKDATVFQILNFLPPPVVAPATTAQQASPVAIANLASGSTTLVPAGTDGTLEAFNIFAYLQGDAATNLTITLQDGSAAPVKFYTAAISTAINSEVNTPIVDLVDLDLRFHNGLYLVQNLGAGGHGQLSANVYYRTP